MRPEMRGVELAKSLRPYELTSAPPFLTLTPRREEPEVLKSLKSDIGDYMRRPFSPEKLVARIKALLLRSDTPENDVLNASGIRIDLVSHLVTNEGKKTTSAS